MLRGSPVSIMHVCGSHEQAIAKFGLRAAFPSELDVVMGPGCPVCVTDVPEVDEAVALAEQGVRIATYGDMLRVPGTSRSLADARGAGAPVDVVYGVAQAAELARATDEPIVFFASGFETTAVATAAVLLAGAVGECISVSAIARISDLALARRTRREVRRDRECARTVLGAVDDDEVLGRLRGDHLCDHVAYARGRRRLAEPRNQCVERGRVAERFDRDAAGVIVHAAGDAELVRDPVHPGPEPDALHRAADLDPQASRSRVDNSIARHRVTRWLCRMQCAASLMPAGGRLVARRAGCVRNGNQARTSSPGTCRCPGSPYQAASGCRLRSECSRSVDSRSFCVNGGRCTLRRGRALV
jgi:hypothetical protein